jgi:hypothetical protein
MIPSADDNDPCGAFLRRYRPEPPDPKGDLEGQVMAAVIAEALVAQRRSRRRARCRQWGIPTLAAALLMAWGGWVNLRSPAPEASDLADLKEFLAEAWSSGAYGEDSDRLSLDTAQTDWMLSVYATPY